MSTPRTKSPKNTYSSATFLLEWIADEPTRRSCIVKYLPKSRPLAVKSPAQSLDYRVNSCYIHLNTLEFHGYEKEISQKFPCSLYPINTSFIGTLSLPRHITSSKPISLAAALSKNPRTPANLPQWCVFDLLHLGRKCPSTSSSLRSIYFHLSPVIVRLYLLQLYLLSVFPSFPFFLFFQSSNLRN